MKVQSTLVAVALLAPLSANASIYIGNPGVLSFHVSRPEHDLDTGSVVLHQLRLHKCNGQTLVWTVDATIDPVEGWGMTIPAGEHCSVTLVWDSAMEIESAAFVVEYDQASTPVQLSSQITPVTLSPIDVVSGTFTGNSPRLVVDID